MIVDQNNHLPIVWFLLFTQVLNTFKIFFETNSKTQRPPALPYYITADGKNNDEILFSIINIIFI